MANATKNLSEPAVPRGQFNRLSMGGAPYLNNWESPRKVPRYLILLRKLFFCFFLPTHPHEVGPHCEVAPLRSYSSSWPLFSYKIHVLEVCPSRLYQSSLPFPPKIGPRACTRQFGWGQLHRGVGNLKFLIFVIIVISCVHVCLFMWDCICNIWKTWDERCKF